jgi:hypothetical protein
MWDIVWVQWQRDQRKASTGRRVSQRVCFQLDARKDETKDEESARLFTSLRKRRPHLVGRVCPPRAARQRQTPGGSGRPPTSKCDLKLRESIVTFVVTLTLLVPITTGGPSEPGYHVVLRA